MKQKIICILLCFATLLLVIVPSHAEESSPSDIISVKLEWTEMSFSFCGGEWDENLHVYEGRGWTSVEEEARITVKNECQLAIKTGFSYVANEGFEDIDIQFLLNETQTINEKTIDPDEIITVSVIPTGEPTKTFAKTAIGNIVVTIERSTEE